MCNNQTVSFLIPSYNSEKYIEECLDSVARQSHKDIEIILVDDHSTDGTWIVVEKFLENHIDLPFTYCCNIEKGLVSALNYGITLCSGLYIARMDADDICDENRVSIQVEYLIANSLDVCGSYINILRGKWIKYLYKLPMSHSAIIEMLKFQNAIAHPAVLVRSSVYRSYKYSNDYKFAEDYELWCRLAVNGFKFGNVPLPLLTYRVHAGQVSNIKREMQLSVVKKIQGKYTSAIQDQQITITSDLAILQAEFLKRNPNVIDFFKFILRYMISDLSVVLRTLVSIIKRYVS